MLGSLLDSLYGHEPDKVLYHYASLTGMMGIMSSKSLWATEIKYLNDADELKYLGDVIRRRILASDELDPTKLEILRQFRGWTEDRFNHGHLLFVCSFTESGNLLSQWRGYCPPGEGVSLGFSAALIRQMARKQSFLMGKCIYDRGEHERIADEIISTVLELALESGPSIRKHVMQSYYETFESLELDMLRIAALLKNPSFSEEREWRIVSPFHKNYAQAPIKYRSGRSMLIPFVEFGLVDQSDEKVQVDRVYLGPTVNINLSMASVTMYLTKYADCSRVTNSSIPFRG